MENGKAIAIGLAVVVVIVALVWVSRQGKTPTPPGPDPLPISCYEWASYNPSAKKFPSDILGVPSGSSLAPVGAQNTDGKWYLGTTSVSPSDSSWGNFTGGSAGSGGGGIYFKPAQMWYLRYAANCSTGIAKARTGDPVLMFHGIPVCHNFGTGPGAFAPGGPQGCLAWSGMGSFDPVADRSR